MQLSFLFVCLWNSKRFIFVASLNLGWFFGRRESERARKNFFYFRFRMFVKSIMARRAANTKSSQPRRCLGNCVMKCLISIRMREATGFWYRKGLWLAPINHADERWVSQWVIAFNDQEKKHEQRRAKKERLEAKIYSLFIPCRAFLCSTSSWNVFFSAPFIKTREKYVLMKFHSCLLSLTRLHYRVVSHGFVVVSGGFANMLQLLDIYKFSSFIIRQTVDNGKKCLFAEEFVSLHVGWLRGAGNSEWQLHPGRKPRKPDRWLIAHGHGRPMLRSHAIIK